MNNQDAEIDWKEVCNTFSISGKKDAKMFEHLRELGMMADKSLNELREMAANTIDDKRYRAAYLNGWNSYKV